MQSPRPWRRAGSRAAFLAFLALAPFGHAASDMEACILAAIATADDSTSIGEIRESCRDDRTALKTVTVESNREKTVFEQQDLLANRFDTELALDNKAFAITANRPNYIMYTVMDKPNQAPFTDFVDDPSPVQDEEIQFQVSIKAPVWRNMFGTNLDTMVAYTSRSYWQLFNDDFSAPFRETNYEPEIYVRDVRNFNLLGVNIAGWSLGLNHQSNGQTQRYSRSWNRVMAKSAVSLTDNLALLGRLWYRIPEDKEDDDNPGMHRYFGYGDLRAVWAPNRNTFTAMLRPGTQETSFELTWSYPISRVFRLYAQYYNGYGESLLDYNYDMERFGIGIAMNDYLQRF